MCIWIFKLLCFGIFLRLLYQFLLENPVKSRLRDVRSWAKMQRGVALLLQNTQCMGMTLCELHTGPWGQAAQGLNHLLDKYFLDFIKWYLTTAKGHGLVVSWQYRVNDWMILWKVCFLL